MTRTTRILYWISTLWLALGMLFFAMSGAAFSHLAAGSAAKDLFPSLLLLVLTGISWYLRPAGRKVRPADRTIDTLNRDYANA